MTEDQAKKELFALHKNYMNHTPSERLELYDEYQSERKRIKGELSEYIAKKKELLSKND